MISTIWLTLGLQPISSLRRVACSSDRPAIRQAIEAAHKGPSAPPSLTAQPSPAFFAPAPSASGAAGARCRLAGSGDPRGAVCRRSLDERNRVSRRSRAPARNAVRDPAQHRERRCQSRDSMPRRHGGARDADPRLRHAPLDDAVCVVAMTHVARRRLMSWSRSAIAAPSWRPEIVAAQEPSSRSSLTKSTARGRVSA